MITKDERNRCTNHHDACDCREWQFEQMQKCLREAIELRRRILRKTDMQDDDSTITRWQRVADNLWDF